MIDFEKLESEIKEVMSSVLEEEGGDSLHLYFNELSSRHYYYFDSDVFTDNKEMNLLIESIPKWARIEISVYRPLKDKVDDYRIQLYLAFKKEVESLLEGEEYSELSLCTKNLLLSLTVNSLKSTFSMYWGDDKDGLRDLECKIVDFFSDYSPETIRFVFGDNKRIIF